MPEPSLPIPPEPDNHSTPADWCARWGIKLLEEIPHPGLATAKDMAGAEKWPGRNHPRAGLWLWDHYGRPERVADPMFGAGALWLHVDVPVEDAEIERGGKDARTWRPPQPVDFVMFSPPFRQSHSSGQTEHQREIRERKGLHAMQEFGASPGNIGRMKGGYYQAMLDVYRQVRSYTASTGLMVVILRNYIRRGDERDEVGDHVKLMTLAGWYVLGAHPRVLRPTGYTQWKLARDPSTPWIKNEWAVVARPGGAA